MKKEKGLHEKQEESGINQQDGPELKDKGTHPENKATGDVEATVNQELDSVKSLLGDKARQCDEYLSMLQRTAAEFDNYKKRTAKEKEALYSEAVNEVVLSFLPVIDNLERALQASAATEGTGKLKEGVDLVLRQIKDIMKNLDIEEVKSVGETFDPQLHHAVMHIEDGSYGENVVVEEFQKGYILKEKVIRHSMVKVAN